MKALLIMLLFFGGSGILMVLGVLLCCAWEFYHAPEPTESFEDDD
jgi:predicted cobalt transporter CbtA